MSKIRINELARELEVKPSTIIDMLADLGVTDKKTHSSSIEDDAALAIRTRLASSGKIEKETIERPTHAHKASQADLFDSPLTETTALPEAVKPAEKIEAKSAEKPLVASAAADHAPIMQQPEPVQPVRLPSHLPIRPPLARGTAPRISIPQAQKPATPPSIPIPPAARPAVVAPAVVAKEKRP